MRYFLFIKAVTDGICYYLFDGQTVGKLITGMKVYNIEAPKEGLEPKTIGKMILV